MSYMEFKYEGVRCSCGTCVHRDVQLPAEPCKSCFAPMPEVPYRDRQAVSYEPRDVKHFESLKAMIEKYRVPLQEIKKDLEAHGISFNELVVYQLGAGSNSMYI